MSTSLALFASTFTSLHTNNKRQAREVPARKNFWLGTPTNQLDLLDPDEVQGIGEERNELYIEVQRMSTATDDAAIRWR